MNGFIRTFRQDMARGLPGRTLLAAILTALAIPLDNPEVVQNIGTSSCPSIYYFLFYSISFGGLFSIYFIPIFCALPAGTGFAEDCLHGFLPYVAARGGKRSYLMSKYVSSVLLGGLAMSGGVALLIAALSTCCPPIYAHQIYGIDLYMQGVTPDYMLPYYGYSIYYAFLNGCLYGGVAMCVSAYIRSIYFTLASPFMAAFLIVQGQRALHIPNECRFDMWLRMRTVVHSNAATMLLSAGCVLLLVCALCAAFMQKGKKVIEHV